MKPFVAIHVTSKKAPAAATSIMSEPKIIIDKLSTQGVVDPDHEAVHAPTLHRYLPPGLFSDSNSWTSLCIL
jgi:hypothetical protein